MPSHELTFSNDGLDFHGTLLLPDGDGPFPAALVVSGSGPLDRDANTKKLAISTSIQIAQALAKAGVASFRFDKRGVPPSGGDFPSTGFFDNVSDARAALETMRAHQAVDADRCFGIGHSEGAAIVTELATDTAGIVLLAGPAQNGRAVLEWQGKRVAETFPAAVGWIIKLFRIDVSKQQTKQLDKLTASTDDVMKIQFQKVNAKWFREFLAHDPADTLRGLETPVLAITGDHDIQVDPGDVARIGELVAGPFEGHVLESVTHLLRTEEAEPNLRTYKKQAKEPMAPVVLALVTDWITRV